MSGLLPWEKGATLKSLLLADAIEPYLNASLLLAFGSFCALGWPVAGPFASYFALLIDLCAWIYLVSATSQSVVARIIFIASAGVGVVSFAAGVDRSLHTPGFLPPSVFVVLGLTIPLSFLHPLVFGPVIVLHGVLFSYAAQTTPEATVRGRVLVFAGSAVLAIIAFLAIASGSYAAFSLVFWAGLPSLGYLLVAGGIALERRAKKSPLPSGPDDSSL